MKNSYEIRGDVTAIFLKRRDGSVLETLIDTDDLSRARDFPNTWCAQWNSHTCSFYVRGNMPRENGKQTAIYFHRWLMDAPKGLQVDHVDHDTLYNRRYNLRIVSCAENQQNRKGAARNNKSSGILGVSWHKQAKKWQAKIWFEGKQRYLGLFTGKHEAFLVAAEARSKLMPYSLEANIK